MTTRPKKLAFGASKHHERGRARGLRGLILAVFMIGIAALLVAVWVGVQ